MNATIGIVGMAALVAVMAGACVDVEQSSEAGADPTGKASDPVVGEESDGPIGTAEQRWSPLGLGCGLFTLAAGYIANHALCNQPKAEHPKACTRVAELGFGGLGILCVFM